MILGCNRDLFQEDSLSNAFYREFKNSQHFGLVFELNRNLAGYSKDVHGQLNVIQNTKPTMVGAPTQSVKNIKFRLQENRVELFDHFVI